MKLPPPIIRPCGKILVVRDDLLPGGTKRRVIGPLLEDCQEAVYAGPRYGYAQIALAHACRDRGKQATVFVADSKELHQRSLEAQEAGALVVKVPAGYLNVVRRTAQEYCVRHGAKLLPFGMDDPAVIEGIAGLARGMNINPVEVWTVAGTGVLTRGLQLAWPAAQFLAVQIGQTPDIGKAYLWKAPEAFEKEAGIKPPFPSCPQYDAKAWRFIQQYASKGALFWNVAR